MISRASLSLALVLAFAFSAFASPDTVGRYAAPEGAPYTTEEVRIQAPEGHVLAGTLTMPRSSLPPARRPTVPAVVLISGAGKQDRDLASGAYRPFFQIADTLSRRGIAVLRLDDRGVGASTGTLDSTDTVDRSGDTRAAIEYLRRRPDVAKERIALVGHSEGALIAPMLASTDPGIRAIVLMSSPGRVGRDVVRWQRRNWADHESAPKSRAARDSMFEVAMYEWEQKAASDKWTRFYGYYDPLHSAQQVRVPVLILQGTADETIPLEDSGRLAEAFRAGGNRDVTRIELPGLTHTFVDVKDFGPDGPLHAEAAFLSNKLLGTIADWAVLRLRPSP